jgi:hypothetical protein
MNEVRQARTFDDLLQSLKGRTVTEIQSVILNIDGSGSRALLIRFGALSLSTIVDSLTITDDQGIWPWRARVAEWRAHAADVDQAMDTDPDLDPDIERCDDCRRAMDACVCGMGFG